MFNRFAAPAAPSVIAALRGTLANQTQRRPITTVDANTGPSGWTPMSAAMLGGAVIVGGAALVMARKYRFPETEPVAHSKPAPSPKPVYSELADHQRETEAAARTAHHITPSNIVVGIPGSSGFTGTADASGWQGSSAYTSDVGVPRSWPPSAPADTTVGASVGAGGRMAHHPTPIIRGQPSPAV